MDITCVFLICVCVCVCVKEVTRQYLQGFGAGEAFGSRRTQRLRNCMGMHRTTRTVWTEGREERSAHFTSPDSVHSVALITAGFPSHVCVWCAYFRGNILRATSMPGQ